MEDDEQYRHLFPVGVEVEQGKKYYWCSCGEARNQPFCDKERCGDKRFCFIADLTEEVYFCNCKQTKNPPFCDGSHGRLLVEAIKKRQIK